MSVDVNDAVPRFILGVNSCWIIYLLVFILLTYFLNSKKRDARVRRHFHSIFFIYRLLLKVIFRCKKFDTYQM